jgi:hypothetical protein
MEAIHEFELILDAKVNLEKSKLIQLDHGERLEWYAKSAYMAVEDGQLIKHLGCPFGRQISQQQEVQFILDKMRNKLRHSKN